MLRPISTQSKNLDEISMVISAQSNIESYELSKILITGISQTSHDIEEGDIFIALPGEKTHGAKFASDAIKRGAKAILTDSDGAALITGVPVLITSNPRRSAGVLSAPQQNGNIINNDHLVTKLYVTSAIASIPSSVPLYGATSARPITPATGTQYLDTTLGYPIWYLPPNWINATGATV
jgi:hypothetical protein